MFHDTIRKSTRGGVESKGNPDQTTTEYHLRAPVVVSGEQRFAGPAEQRRSILTTFRDGATDPDSDEARAFAELNGGSFREQDNQITHFDGYDLLDHAHVYHRWALNYDADAVRQAWHDAEETVLDTLDAYGIGDVDSAGRTALQTILFGIGVYRAFASDMDATVPFKQDDRDRAITYVAKQQGNDGRRESHLDEFVRLCSLAAMDNELEEDRHYTRTYDRNAGSEIRVNLSRAYPKVAQYVRNHGLDDTTELLDKGDYQQRFGEGVEDDSSYVTAHSQNSPPVSRCVGIDPQQAADDVDGFDDDHFYGREEQGENGRYESDK